MRANKRHFMRYKPNARADGGRDSDDLYPEGSVYESVWGKIVATMYGRKIDPVEYVHKVFAGLIPLSDYVPSPKALLTDRCLLIYERAMESIDSDIQIAFRSQHSTLQSEIAHIRINSDASMEEAIEEALWDEQLPMSSLFRYCVAAGMPGDEFAELANTFRVGAAVQYVRHKAIYDRVWGDFIPRELKKSAAGIYHKVNEHLGEGTVVENEE